ncbi:MAG: hypothetical protein JW864_00765 [Spirochaetes bacterium]|nr:hypothetical protein [Spirochaetota bacterium]
MKNRILLIIVLAFFLAGCGKLKGNFAFKKTNEDVYRKINTPLEFEKNEKINWVYVFSSNIDASYTIIVTLLKKELVWVDLSSRAEQISASSKIIYGNIENLSDGTYRIVLSNMDRIIAEREFEIFSEEEEYYEYDSQ